MKKLKILSILLLAFFVLGVVLGAAARKDKKGKVNKTSALLQNPDSYRLEVNRLSIPINDRGVIADVQIGGSAGGQIDGKVFLFSGGFFMSGYNDKGIMWSNAVASASRTEDYLPGTVAGGAETGGLYIVKKDDPPYNADGTPVKAGLNGLPLSITALIFMTATATVFIIHRIKTVTANGIPMKTARISLATKLYGVFITTVWQHQTETLKMLNRRVLK